MSRRFIWAGVLMACVLFLGESFAQAAEDVLKLVPDSASGLVLIKNLTATDAKLQSLARQSQLPIPSLLAMLKLQSGVYEGVDENGTLALVVLPPENEGGAPRLIVLVPVTDYDKFIAQLTPRNAKDGVAEITFVGSPSLVRSIGGYAALTGPEFRDDLKSLKVAEQAPAVVTAWREWLAGQDVGGIIFRPGIKRVASRMQRQLEMMKMMMAQGTEQMKATAGVFDFYGKLAETAEKEFSAAGLGLQFDKQNVLHVASRKLLMPDGKLAHLMAQGGTEKAEFLKGLPDEPFVVAGGVAFSDAAWNAVMAISADLIKDMRGVYNLSEEQAKKMPAMWAGFMNGVHGMSIVLGESSGKSIYGSTVAMMQVENAPAFLVNYEKTVKQYADFLKDANSPMLRPMDVEKSDVGGIPALQITVKAPKLPADQQPPGSAKMMEAMFGPEGKLVAWIVPADEHHVMIGYVSKDLLQRTLTAFKQGSPGLEKNAAVSMTAALLPSNTAAVLYLSPAGAIDILRQIVPAMVPPMAAVIAELPDFPATPPLGFALTTAPNEIQTTLVVPAEIIQAIGPYMAKIREARSHTGTLNVAPGTTKATP